MVGKDRASWTPCADPWRSMRGRMGRKRGRMPLDGRGPAVPWVLGMGSMDHRMEPEARGTGSRTGAKWCAWMVGSRARDARIGIHTWPYGHAWMVGSRARDARRGCLGHRMGMHARGEGPGLGRRAPGPEGNEVSKPLPRTAARLP